MTITWESPTISVSKDRERADAHFSSASGTSGHCRSSGGSKRGSCPPSCTGAAVPAAAALVGPALALTAKVQQPRLTFTPQTQSPTQNIFSSSQNLKKEKKSMNITFPSTRGKCQRMVEDP